MLQSYLDYYEENKHELSKDKLYEVLAYINEEVTDIPVKTFVAKTAEYVENVMLDKLEECIISREKETKGTSRAKLTNWKKYVGAKHVEAFGLDYRWGLVYSMIKEIKEGLDNGK